MAKKSALKVEKKVKNKETQSMRLELKEEKLKGLSLGEEVAITLKGTVESVSAPYKSRYPDETMDQETLGSLSLEIVSIDIKEAGKENPITAFDASLDSED